MERWQRANYTPVLPLGKDGKRVTASPEHIAVSKKAALEGMVLLKNRGGTLPLEKGTHIALFGKATFDYVKGGGGSGDVYVPYMRNLYDGLIQIADPLTIFDGTADYYRAYVQEQYAKGGLPGLIPEPELPEELVKKARAFADTAVISISRYSGEGWDRKTDKAPPPPESGWSASIVGLSYAIFEDGDFYFTAAERALIEKVAALFPRAAVVLNVGGMVETDWLEKNDRIGAVLLGWQGGMEGGAAEAELLMGVANPSGKLSDTFARRLEDYPSADTFYESDDYVDYYEDIYVGYRYFETVPGAAEKVVYPFGYGLSYTSFALTEQKVVIDGDEVTASVCVTNTGDRAGREVVQVYGSAPQGRLGKPAKVLCGYRKTGLLAPGEKSWVTVRFPVTVLASYDDLGKVRKSAWLMEKGDYRFFVGTSVRDVEESETVLTLEEDRIVEQLTARAVPTSLSRRMLADGSFEPLPMSEPHPVYNHAPETLPDDGLTGYMPEVRPVPRRMRRVTDRPQLLDVAEGRMTLDDFVAQLSDEDVAHLLGGQPNTGVANTFGYGNNVPSGIPNIMSADGPAGARFLLPTGVKTTAFPVETLLCCTWDPEICYQVGAAGALECKENNIGAWLTPAVCIHRNPICGRNFEYFSEDPLLTGKQAAALVRGIQSEHIAATPKHFALNNKETNRRNSDSRASERAIREIYIKQFEIIVKESDPWSIMSSYNIINGSRASENRDLLTGVLREEWGWEGMITTDWWTYGEHYRECMAGNDIKLGCGFPERLLDALEKGLLTREAMNTAAKHILGLILRID
ncbi:MAG: glycoside hydrolase family 3 protein [Clostridia bacterium]|nr:glycoside hydrolase family 3 protein [Clostridia bacterium]